MKAKKKYSKPKLVSTRSKIALVCSIIICVIYLFAIFPVVPVEKEDCETVVTEFDYCEKKEIGYYGGILKSLFVPDRGMHIYCMNSESYYLFANFLGYGREERIETLSKGTELTIIYDSYDGEIVELTAEGDVIFSYSDYVQGMKKNEKLNIFGYCLLLLIPLINIIHIYKEKHRFD